MMVLIKQGCVYRWKRKLVKLLSQSMGAFGKPAWEVESLDGKKRFIADEEDLGPAFTVKPSKKHGGGI